MSSPFFARTSKYVKSKMVLCNSAQKERPAEMPVFRKERN